MDLRLDRLRRGELIAGASALALLVLLFAAHWYGARTGWQALPRLRWLALVTGLTGLALALTQATRRAPALPASISVLATVLAFVSAVWLAFDVIVNAQPHQRVWAIVGLLVTLALLAGSFLSLREEGISPRDAPAEIPTLQVGRGAPS